MKKPTKTLPPVDDTVALPKAVREAAARAAQIQTEAYPNPLDPDAAPPETQPGSGEDGGDQVRTKQQLELPLGDPPAPPAAEHSVIDEPAADANQPTGDQDWERRYNAIKGRFDRSQAQVAQLTERLGEVERLLATTHQTPPSAPVDDAPPNRLITEQEENEYGTEFLGVVGKRARDEVLPEVHKLRRELQTLANQVQTVNNVTTMSARERMEQTLDQRLPTWRDVNYDPKFLAWLRLPDSYSGAIRQELLTQAYQRNETSRVLAFFNGFLSEEAAEVPQEDQLHPAPVTTGGKVPLETLAAPGRAKTAAAPPIAPAEKPVFTGAQISRFYADVSAGKYRGREDEKARIENAIFEAQSEGRIRSAS